MFAWRYFMHHGVVTEEVRIPVFAVLMSICLNPKEFNRSFFRNFFAFSYIS